MFLKLINIEHFGAWENSVLDEFELSTTVIYGPNEAGKSTLMEFIRGIFFGWTENDRTKYLNNQRELPQGGEITLEDQSENVWKISRTAIFGSNDQWRDKVRITRNDASIDENAAWEQLFQNISEAVFENVFTIGLNELEELAALDRSEAAEFLYDLSAGAERVALSHAALEVSRHADGIVDKNSSWNSIDFCLKEQAKQQTIVNDGAVAMEKWCRLSNRVSSLDQEVEQKQKERKSLEVRLNDAKSAIEAIPLLEQRNALYAVIKNSRVPGDWDERQANDAIANLRQLEEEKSDICQKQAEREAARGRFLNECDSLSLSSQILAAGPRIQSLEDQSSWIASLTGQIIKYQEELDQIERELDAIGSTEQGEWLSTGRSTLVALRQPARQFREAKHRLEEARISLTKSIEECNSIERELESNKSECGVTDVELAVAKNGERIRTIRQRIEVTQRLGELTKRTEILGSKRDYWSHRQLPSITQLAVLGILFVTGTTFLLTLLFLSNYLSLSGVSRVACLAFGVAGIAGSLIGKFACQIHARQQLDKYANKLEIADTQNEQLVSLRNSLNEKLGESPQGYEALLEAEEQRSDTLAGILPVKTRVDAALNKVTEKQAQFDAQQTRLQEISTAWENALIELGIPAHLSPSMVKKCVNSGKEVRAKQQRIQWLKSELADRARDLDNISYRVASIYEDIGAEQESTDLLSCIRNLSGLILAEERKEHRANELQLAMDRESYELNRLEEQLFELQRKSNQILIGYGVCDLQSLIENVAHWSEIGEKLNTIAELDQQLQPFLAVASQSKQTLDNYSMPELNAVVQKVQEELDGFDLYIAKLNQEIGGVRQQLEDCVADRSFDDAALEVNRIGVCLDSHVRDWQVLATTNALFHMLRTEYETSRQPEVLLVASELIQQFSDGKYTRIWTPVEEAMLYLEDANGEVWTLDVLSRGTREAVFLCIRFALVKHYASRGLRLPLILDDVLVNFDQERMRGALSVIEKMHDCVSQVFFFTCHKHIRDAFGELQADVRSISARTDLKAPALKRYWVPASQLPVVPAEELEANVVILDTNEDDDTVLMDDFDSKNKAA